MKISKWILMSALMALVMAGFVVLTGCEDDPSTDVADINPESSVEHEGEPNGDLVLSPNPGEVSSVGAEVLFTIDGGEPPFEWEVAVNDRGTITPQGDSRQAVYRCTQVVGNTVIAHDVNARSGSADVLANSAGSFHITPASSTFTSSYYATNAPGGLPIDLNGAVVTFRVDGGVPPYGTWQVSAPNLGTINPNTGVYTVNGTWGTGGNTVSISDSGGGVATATVTIQFKQ